MQVPEEARELEKELRQITKEKNEAVRGQDFEKVHTDCIYSFHFFLSIWGTIRCLMRRNFHFRLGHFGIEKLNSELRYLQSKRKARR